MALSSKQFVRARITRAKFRQLLKLFALDLTATQIIALTDLNRNTINRYLRLIRSAIAQHCQRESPFSGDVELDESYFNLLGLTERLSLWRGFHDQQIEEAASRERQSH